MVLDVDRVVTEWSIHLVDKDSEHDHLSDLQTDERIWDFVGGGGHGLEQTTPSSARHLSLSVQWSWNVKR